MISGKLNVVIKPVSQYCDLNCRYCVHKDPSVPASAMTMDLARSLLEQVFSLTKKGAEITFTFQGGEPTLTGLRFYQEFTSLATQMCPPGRHLFWAMQTHGLNIDDGWIELFYKYDFEVSVSVDGYQSLHDENRVDAQGAGTWKRVRAAFRKLREKDIVVNALCVVTKQSSRRPEMIYQSLRRMGASNIIFRPCMDAGTRDNPWSLTPPHYANFLCRVFDVWHEDWEKGEYCYINLFDDCMRLIRGQRASACTACGSCAGTIVIDGDGRIYPCEKYVSDADCIGSVGRDGIEGALGSRKYQDFLRKGLQKPAECRECSRFTLCGGGCPYDWVTTPKGMYNPFCSAYRRFFLYAYPRLVEIAQETRET